MLNIHGRVMQEMMVESFVLPINNTNKEMVCETVG